MPHVKLPPLPGIVGLLAQYPRTGEQLSGLADALLRGPSSLTPAERETIGAYVSARNNCEFCASTHSAVARRLHAGEPAAGSAGSIGTAGSVEASAVAAGAVGTAGPAQASGVAVGAVGATGPAEATAAAVDAAISGGETAEVGAKMQALLALAEKVRVDGRSVTDADIRRARDAGADDQAVHDTVLTAALFSMFNRYVDGLATLTPEDPEHYDRHARMLADNGYRQPPAA
jgi:AhpD family alkylhydroperoxidase